MDFDDPEHISLLRDSLARFVEAEMPRQAAARWDRDDVYPRDVVNKLAELGLMGLTVPQQYGGSGPDILATMVTIEELSRRSLAVSVPYIMAACYGGMNILAAGSEEQKRTLLPKLANGDMLFAYGLTEPDIGSDLAEVRTRAERHGDQVIVNGAKRFCTGAEIADYIYTLVRSDAQAPRHQNLSLLLISPKATGVSIERLEAIGLRGPNLCEVTFEDVAIPVANI
ncbi:MAG: acyl-CoA/acyl-ACP dehydrogenase, partial [Gammaproteobacteria bacterium]|nr:acyl-CoA/acyl-ACP dehydrogenase [Gammaproteobacteria bacterium]